MKKTTLLVLFTTAGAIGLPACGGESHAVEDADALPDDQGEVRYDLDAGEDVPADPQPEDTLAEEAGPEFPTDTDAVQDPPEEEGELPAACEAEIAAIAEETSGSVISCSAVVRLDYESFAILGWQLFCGHYASVDETAARATAQADTGYGASGTMLNPEGPGDEYVFYLAPGDFGGTGVVSARNGLSVFGGSIIWMGTGEITYPDDWRPASGLGSDCPELPEPVPAVGYDLRTGETLPSSDVAAALDIVWSTALPMGMAASNYVFDAVVILYPPVMGGFDPAAAEWIVILNGGWLE